ncbi:TonB-dependent receptor [soil metagenome]
MKCIHTKLLCFIVIVCCCHSISPCYSQSSIKGKVIDAISRQPLENVIVREIKSQSHTMTDQYGNFKLRNELPAQSLLVSYAGYKPDTVYVGEKTELKIELQQDVISLADVVILQSNITTRFNTLSKIDLDLKPVKNTQELMRLVPGLFVAQHAGGGKAEQIFLRGFDCDHGTDVEVSIDGMPVNMVSHAHGQGYADAHFIIPETVNNIDFGAGPYYTQHGNLNTAGYVAFGTYDNIPTSRVQIEAGRFNTVRSLVMLDLLKKNKDKQSAYIAGDFNYSDGATINKQHFKRFNLFGKYNLAVNDNTQFIASASFFKSNWDASGQVPERAVESGEIDRFGSIDPTEGGNTGRTNVNLKLAHHFKNGALWENQAYYSRYQFSLYSNFTFFLNDPVNGDEINQAEGRNLFGYSSKFHRQFLFNKWSLKSTYGTGIRYDATSDSKLANVTKRVFLSDVKLGDIKEANLYGFVQQQVSFGKWLIDAGVRLDYLHFNYLDKLTSIQMPSQGKSIVSPKLNIQYTLNQSVQFFLKSGKGFHSNDTRVVTANSGKQILPAAYGTDIGFILKPSRKLLLSMAAWYLYLDQEFVYVGDDGNIEPSGKSRRQGIDLIARYQFANNLFANVNLNITKPRALNAPKGEDYIPLAPTFTSTGGVFYKAKQGFNGGLTYRYIKSRPADEINSITAKGYFLLDASVNYSTTKYEIGISAENLLNEKWNEAQFATTSRLRNEPTEVTELNFTPGTPIFIKLKFARFF